MKRFLAILPLVAVLLVGCSSGEESTPSGDAFTQEEIHDLAFEMTWSDLSYSERADLCRGFEISPSVMVDAFLNGADGVVTAPEVYDFFSEKCS